jgi:fructosamine-3-kinase
VRTFSKRDPGAPAGFFAVEAAGLRWLADAEAAGGARVPRPLAVSEHGIELPVIARAEPGPDAAEAFGRQLATTHAAGAAAFGAPPAGWDGDGYIGPLPLPHGRWRRWGEFYATARLVPYARRASEAGSLPASGLNDVGAVCAALAGGALDDGAGPARLHGDLWSGNVLWTPDGVVFVDPAAHGGHRETDLAMLQLFGLPHLSRVLAAYTEATPLPDGWRERVPLHQLHPLLVHAVLFGAGYGAQAAAAASAARRLTSP